MELPNVKNVNKGKKRLKKHHFKPKDMVAYKWYAEKEVGYIMECYHSSDGWACYKIKSASKPGCIYSDMQLDDPEDPYCYISSVLTKSMTGGEKELVRKRIEWSESKNLPNNKPIVEKKAEKVVVDKAELKRAIEKQKDFINGKFW
jgi:hypothetical protein